MNAVFRVHFDQKFGKDKYPDLDGTASNSQTVAARDADDAIGKVRREQMMMEINATDSEGEVIEGKKLSCTGIRIHHVEFISAVELL